MEVSHVMLFVAIFSLCQLDFVLCRFNVDELNSIFYDVSISGVPVLKKNDEDSSENIIIGNKNGQQYVCTLPSVDDELFSDQTKRRQRRVENIFNLTESDLFETLNFLQSRKCLTKTVGWWTYEFCYNRAIYQYHLENGRISGEKIVLGRYESDQALNHTNLIEQFVDRKQSLYHSQFYTNGSLCNLNSKLRKAEARFFCDDDSGFAELTRIDEPQTCQYVFHIGLAGLCKIPAFLPTDKKRDPTNVSCQPLLSAEDYEIYEKEEQERLEKEKILKESTKDASSEKEYSVYKISSDGTGKHSEQSTTNLENDESKTTKSNEENVAKIWKQMAAILDEAFEGQYKSADDDGKKNDNLQIADLNVDLGGDKEKIVDPLGEGAVSDESESKEEEYDDVLLADFEKDLKNLFSRESLQYDRGLLRSQVEAEYDELVQEAQNELNYSPEDLVDGEDHAASVLSATLNKLIDRLDRAEREIEMANEQLEVAEEKLLIASKKLEQILKTDKTFKKGDQSKKRMDSKLVQDDTKASSTDYEDNTPTSLPSSKKIDPQTSRSTKPLGRIQIKNTEDKQTPQQGSGDDSNRVKVRVSKIKTQGLPEKAMGKVSEETQRLEAQLASKLKKAGLDAKGGKVQVKIITSGYYDEDTNNFHMLSDEESQQFSNIILSLLGGDEQNREEKRQKSLEDNYEFKFNKNTN